MQIVNRAGTAVWKWRNPQWATVPSGQVAPELDMTMRGLPRYAADRIRLALERRRQPGVARPWLTKAATRLLEERLGPDAAGLEFGSGSSTEWFAGRVGSLLSIESADHWYATVKDRLGEASATGSVRLQLASGASLGLGSAQHREAYVNAHEITDASLDFVLVDGEYRDHCTQRAIRLLRSGGILIIDNAELYLPSDTRSPWRVPQPATLLWRHLVDELAGWQRIWTTNGVWDTAMWIKP